jgi:hypothetical protein
VARTLGWLRQDTRRAVEGDEWHRESGNCSRDSNENRPALPDRPVTPTATQRTSRNAPSVTRRDAVRFYSSYESSCNRLTNG